ncbi:hypothetical protein [Variovorax soli]|uniref:Membrane-bound metal-dependent hydrolase YbcI (DUF457 family) n=1 Tax=Variovorax soli TaxID=376815 RepID=A0ABU1NMA7_9BURK|nr:hypothetical protein [Variovorax soli]MDR6539011.1 membrane-bound metal-dependent hydrolase YbcI (DUF457 family) [Variovorax soli]
MYIGHFAIAMALKARHPDVPALPIVFGAGFLDILDGLFIMLGWDRVTPNLLAGPYLFFDLRFIDWDHSLLAALFWSAIWGAFFLRDRRVAALAFAASFSHFLADWPVHNNDLALYPHAETHWGYGLWGKLGTASWVLEGVFSAALVAYAWVASARRGVGLLWPSIVLVVLFIALSPWLSPMKLAAGLNEPWAHLLQGLLTTLGFVVPGALLIALLEKAQSAAGMRPSQRNGDAALSGSAE